MMFVPSGPSEFTKTALGLYAVGRAVGWLMMALVERQVHWIRLYQRRPFRNWHEMMMRWDAFHYQIIAASGYPAVLPLDDGGVVVQNPWAFFPVFPYVVRGAVALTGLSFETAAVMVNVVAGAAAAVCIAHLARALAGEAPALRTVAFWSFFPTAFVLQLPYSEAIYLAFASAFLLALLTRRHWLAVPLLFAAALSRGYGPSLSAAALFALASDGWTARAQGTPYRALLVRLLRSGGIALALAAIVAPFVWFNIVDAVTRTPGAYAATQAAWGYSRDAAVWRDGWADMLARLNWVDITSVATLAAAAALSIIALWLRQVPALFKVYTLAATALIAATALPGAVSFTSIPRFSFGVITFPLVLGVISRHRWVTTGIVGLFLWLEYLWILNIWTGRIGIAP
jgi:hypothetical protein